MNHQIRSLILSGVLAAGASTGCAMSECTARDDCGAGAVCSLEGRCIDEGERLSKGQRPTVDTRNAQPGAGDGTGTTRMMLIPNGEMSGEVGALSLDGTPAQLIPDNGMLVVSVPASDAAVIFLSSDGAPLTELFTTPGTTHLSGNDLGGNRWTQACTFNETTVDHFDEITDSEIVVSEPDDAGTVTVDITSIGAASNITATVRLAAAPVP